ncbi:protein SRC2-like [Dioscorea cayenensis subsp. rotundata]|uniref:Protein SRC2-like n=1 Tax=Dioscorea cayennensis subsp. rotundata TaxID=55577 RepID=A0AB40BBX1_DIOCR|nr:protein SRC2-like [Dioscorea cayenensis subsp. rotundata]
MTRGPIRNASLSCFTLKQAHKYQERNDLKLCSPSPMASRRTLKLKSISCKGLKFFNLFQKPSICATVSLANPRDRKPIQRHETPVDRDGGENPEWDLPIRFTLEPDRQLDLILRFDLIHKGGLLLGDRIVGEVTVLVADLEAEAIPGVVRHVSYQVKSPEGKPNGVLTLAYKIRDPKAVISVSAPMSFGYHYPSPSEPPPPPPPPLMSSGNYYPSLEVPALAPLLPMASSSYYPPPAAVDPGYIHWPDPAVYYPPYPPEHVGYYPPPVQGGHRTEFSWGRGLTGYN